MASESITREAVIEMIDRLPTEKLPEVAQFVEFLRFKSEQPPKAPHSEETLLVIINRQLPAADQQRLDALRAKSEETQLNDLERAELLAYVERVEREDAERAEAMIRLAHLRGIHLTTLVNQLKITANVV